MYVNHSGWTKEKGSFHYDIFLDETKTDYELHFADGFIAKQTTPFQEVTADWNYDGDQYTQFGAWFESRYGGANFWTPTEMVRALLDGMEDGRQRHPDTLCAIPGIQIPAKDRRPSLKDTILQSEQRALQQEITRSQRMSALGIRFPDEPRVK